jgi:hypothetical protein
MLLSFKRAGILAAALLAGCSSTTFESAWKAPDAGPLAYSGRKVAAIFVSSNESTRRVAEDTLAREITKRGAQGVAAYTLLSPADLKDKEKARDKLLKAGCAGAVMMRVTGKEQQIRATPAAWTGPGYASFSGYSDWGWDEVYEPGYLSTDTIVSIETLVYSLDKDKLVWAGTSETFNPSQTEAFVEDLADSAAEQLKKDGLIQ